MNMRAKMTVSEVTKNAYGQETVKLNCVYSNGKPEDNSFAKATPSGSLTLTIDNPGAQNVMLPGKTVFVDISPAEVSRG